MADAREKRELKVLDTKDIQVGDYVTLPFRNKERAGYVTAIRRTSDETSHPPKVVFNNELAEGSPEVEHNPSALTVVPEKSKREG